MFKVLKGAHELAIKSFLFPGGEVGMQVKADNLAYLFDETPVQTIIARLHNSEDVVRLVMLKDALERFDSTPIRLVLPYVPYARQDRVCNPGDSFSLKAFAKLINGLNFVQVDVVDPHSDVCGAVFERVQIATQADIIHDFAALNVRVLKGATFVSPDAGANKKTAELAAYFGHSHFIRADKLRDLSNGNIKETIVYADDLTGQDVVCADDICDGGRTFIELAKVLKAKGAQKVILYITHAIFSKGVEALFDGGIDEIYTTNSFKLEYDSRVTVMDIEPYLK